MPIADAPRTLAGSMTDGVYGYGYGAALAQDLWETIPALTYPLSIETFARMRRDPQIKAVIGAYTQPLRAGTWAVNPAGCRDEVVALVADAWGLPILGNNDGPGPFRRRGVLWDEHLRLALLMLPFGHSPFAVRYEITDGRARLAELSERLPQTITDIVIDQDTGALKGIRQPGSKDLIPARTPGGYQNLLWYTHEREGAAWQGQSMIREAYAPWLIKHELWRVMATSSRRFGMGVPQVKAPPGGTPSDIAKAAEIAALYRAGDQSGIGLPDGYVFELAGMTGSAPDTLGFVRYLDQQIAVSALEEVLNLSASPNGSRALGETVISLLQLAWQSTANEIAVPASRLNVDMVDINFGEDEPVPAVLCTDINRPEVTSEAISALVACGALTPDLTMENDLRTRYRMPTIDARPPALPALPPGGAPQPVPPPAPALPDRVPA